MSRLPTCLRSPSGAPGCNASATCSAAKGERRPRRGRPRPAGRAGRCLQSPGSAGGPDRGALHRGAARRRHAVLLRQWRQRRRPDDLLVLHSTSGRSLNLIAAARAARTRGTRTVAFLGRGGGALAGEVDEALVVPSDDTALIQSLHLALEHLVVELVESALAGAG